MTLVTETWTVTDKGSTTTESYCVITRERSLDSWSKTLWDMVKRPGEDWRVKGIFFPNQQRYVDYAPTIRLSDSVIDRTLRSLCETGQAPNWN